MNFYKKLKESEGYKYFSLFAIVPMLMVVYSIIVTLFLNFIFDNIKLLNFLSKIEDKDLFLGIITISIIYYTFYFKNKEDKESKINDDLNNFALIEPISIHKEAFMHNGTKIKEEEKNNVKITSNGRIFHLSKITPFHGYDKYVHFPFLHKNSPLFSVINNGKNYGIPESVHILFRKKENFSENKKVYIKDNDLIHTILENAGMSYMFPFEESHFSGHITMTPHSDYDNFYNYFNDLESEKSSFIVIMKYKSILNSKNILQAYKALLIKENKQYYIDTFSPMKKEEILLDIEKEFAKEIIKNSIY